MLFAEQDLLRRETERDWDKELAEEVRAECEDKYGPVAGIKVEKETQVCRKLCSSIRNLSSVFRVKFTSSSKPLNLHRRLSKV